MSRFVAGGLRPAGAIGRVLVACVVLSCLVFTARAASAQVPTPAPTAPPPSPGDQEPVERATNVMLGYQYLRDLSWKEHLFTGFSVTLSHRLGRNVSLVGEVSGSHGHFGTTPFTIQRYAFMGGMKVFGGEGQVRPFFQILAGYSRQGGDVGIANGSVLQPGGGADFFLNDRWTVRGQADYRVIYEDGDLHYAYRFTGGLVLYLGKKK